MHFEIQVALNFFISFLYNKMPRRRVNQFGEELERALHLKFEGHWYPDRPLKGSAYRCLKTTAPLDPVFECAAQESGMDLADIHNNLPTDLSIWIDPGEVSYRMGEKGVVKILYSESRSCGVEEAAVAAAAATVQSPPPQLKAERAFNPEAQCFKPIESQLAALTLGGAAAGGGGGNAGASQGASFLPRSQPTFTIATFAQTKFGSTKLKSASKRSHRMSPTEFNFLKQRAAAALHGAGPHSHHSHHHSHHPAGSRPHQGSNPADPDMFHHLLVAN